MTIKQKQCLLYYLGYYTGNIDGDWGAKSIEATKRLQRDNGIKEDGVFGPNTEEIAISAVFYGKFAKKETAPSVQTTPTTSPSGDWWDDIKYFDKHEFACKCGKCGGFPVQPKEKLIKVADRVREHFGSPITVSSGVRCKTHNANVGGVSNSRHLSGKAMDFGIRGKSANQILAYVQKQPEIRYAYAINGSYVHMDID
jgi:peptidoglycan hydrolase-like protein with peptidoglycan-binding domain